MRSCGYRFPWEKATKVPEPAVDEKMVTPLFLACAVVALSVVAFAFYNRARKRRRDDWKGRRVPSPRPEREETSSSRSDRCQRVSKRKSSLVAAHE